MTTQIDHWELLSTLVRKYKQLIIQKSMGAYKNRTFRRMLSLALKAIYSSLNQKANYYVNLQIVTNT